MDDLTTPTTPAGLEQYDHYPPATAALCAWRGPGPDPDRQRHTRAQAVVRRHAPALAAALDLGMPRLVLRQISKDLPELVARAMPLLARAALRAAEEGHRG